MSRLRRVQPFPLLWLTAVWVLLWGELTAANALAGLVLAAGVLLGLPLPPLIIGVRVRPWRLLVLVVRFLHDVVVASVGVAWQALRPGAVPSSVIVIGLRSRNELFQTVVGEMTSLIPGSLVVDLDPVHGRLAMHVLNIGNREQADAFRAKVLQQEDRVLAALAEDPATAGRRAVGGPR